LGNHKPQHSRGELARIANEKGGRLRILMRHKIWEERHQEMQQCGGSDIQKNEKPVGEEKKGVKSHPSAENPLAASTPQDGKEKRDRRKASSEL